MRGGRRAQHILLFTLFQVMLGFGIMVPILPFFARDLGASSVHMGLLVTVWAGAQFLFAPLWGTLSDRIGRRPVLLLGLLGNALHFGMIALAQNIWLALGARFLGGVLSAATIPTAQAYIADTTPAEERTGRMALVGVAINLGFIGGPTAGGMLAAAGLNYREAILVAAAVAGFNWIVALLALPEPPHRSRREGREKGFSGVQAVRMALGGPHALLFLLAFAGTFGGSTMFSMLGYFLMDRLGVDSEAVTSLAFTVQGLAGILFQGLLVNWASRRFGDERPVRWALIAGMAGMAAFIVARSLGAVFLGMILITLAISLIRPLITALLSRRTRMEQGITMGIQSAFDALGRTVAPAWAGLVYLWQDWAPFASALAVYLLFYLWTRRAWGEPSPHPSAETA